MTTMFTCFQLERETVRSALLIEWAPNGLKALNFKTFKNRFKPATMANTTERVFGKDSLPKLFTETL